MSRQPLHTPEQAQALQKTVWQLHDMNYNKSEIAQKTGLSYPMVRKYLDPYIITKKISVVPRDKLQKLDVIDIDGEQFDVIKEGVAEAKTDNISDGGKEAVIDLYKKGEPAKDIAVYLSMSLSSVYYYINKYKKEEAMNKLLTEPAPEFPKTLNLAPTLNYKKAIKPKTRKPWSVKIEDDKPVAKMNKLEEQIKKLKKMNGNLVEENMELISQVHEQKTRGFWARLFNK